MALRALGEAVDKEELALLPQGKTPLALEPAVAVLWELRPTQAATAWVAVSSSASILLNVWELLCLTTRTARLIYFLATWIKGA